MLAEWRISRVIDEHAPRESTRISSRDIYGMLGSATGEEAIALLKANNDGKAIAVATANAKKDDAAAKKAQDTRPAENSTSHLPALGPGAYFPLSNPSP